MVVVFCLGLIIGTIAGMFSWLAAAAFIEGKRQMEEGLMVGIAVQPVLSKAAADSASRHPQEQPGRVFRARGKALATVTPLGAPDDKRAPRSL